MPLRYVGSIFSMSAEDANARNRKPGTSKEDDGRQTPDDEKEAPRQDFYHRFVESLESALNTVTSTVTNAVKTSSGNE